MHGWSGIKKCGHVRFFYFYHINPAGGLGVRGELKAFGFLENLAPAIVKTVRDFVVTHIKLGVVQIAKST